MTESLSSAQRPPRTLSREAGARIIRVTIEGVWLDMMTMANPYSRDEALTTARSCAALCFANHFTPRGLRLG